MVCKITYCETIKRKQNKFTKRWNEKSWKRPQHDEQEKNLEKNNRKRIKSPHDNYRINWPCNFYMPIP